MRRAATSVRAWAARCAPAATRGTARTRASATAHALTFLVAAGVCGAPEVASPASLFGPGRVTGGGVVWVAAPVSVPPAVDSLRAILAATANPSGADSVHAWRALAADATLGPFARHRLAPMLLAAGDSLGADSTWAALARDRSIWTYEALRGRADLALLRGAPRLADSLLEAADRSPWSDLDRVSWLVRRAELRAMLGDTTQALEFAGQAIRRYPSLPPAPRALSDLMQWLSRRGQSLSADDERAAAEVEFLRPDRHAAALRIARAEAGLDPAARGKASLRRGEILRLDRRFAEAHAALRASWALARDSSARAAVLLERARVFRDAGEPDSAFAAWGRSADLATSDSGRETAWWEAMREAEERERWDLARATANRLARLGGARANDAAVRAGILALHGGELDAARAALGDARGDGAMFWRAVAERRAGRGGADSLLAALARAPGYGFYRVAARETLGVSGWPGTLTPPAMRLEPGVRLAALLVAIDAGDEAVRVLDRWSLGDRRLSDMGERFAPLGAPSGATAESHAESVAPDSRSRQLLAAAQVAYGAGRWATGIRYARAAFEATPDSAAAEKWGAAPWMVPPALDAWMSPESDRATGGAPDHAASADPAMVPERSLVYGVVWQESKFDPRARSRSNALGLMQLKLPTAIEQARLLRLAAPSEAAVLDPALNLKLGSAYLGRLLARFAGRATIALAAYNAGPTAAARWARILDPGGEAMACELIGYGQAHDYVKTILGVRQAARETHPRRE